MHVIIPAYNEEKVIDQIIKAMKDIDYPREKLDIIITLEEYDHPTINAIKRANPPSYFKTLIELFKIRLWLWMGVYNK